MVSSNSTTAPSGAHKAVDRTPSRKENSKPPPPPDPSSPLDTDGAKDPNRSSTVKLSLQAIRTNALPKSRAATLAILDLPTPGGPHRHRVCPVYCMASTCPKFAAVVSVGMRPREASLGTRGSATRLMAAWAEDPPPGPSRTGRTTTKSPLGSSSSKSMPSALTEATHASSIRPVSKNSIRAPRLTARRTAASGSRGAPTPTGAKGTRTKSHHRKSCSRVNRSTSRGLCARTTPTNRIIKP